MCMISTAAVAGTMTAAGLSAAAASTTAVAATQAGVQGTMYSTGGGLLGKAGSSFVASEGEQAASTAGAQTASASSSGVSAGQLTSAGLQLGAGAIQAYGAIKQGKEEEKAYKSKAEQERQQARQTMEQAEIEAMDLQRRQKQKLGTGKALAAANGIAVDDARAGAVPTMWEEDVKAENEWDRTKLLYNANKNARLRHTGVGGMPERMEPVLLAPDPDRSEN